MSSNGALLKNRPVPQVGQNDRRPLADDSYTRGSPWIVTDALGTIAHATIGVPDCLRQSSQWQIVEKVA